MLHFSDFLLRVFVCCSNLGFVLKLRGDSCVFSNFDRICIYEIIAIPYLSLSAQGVLRACWTNVYQGSSRFDQFLSHFLNTVILNSNFWDSHIDLSARRARKEVLKGHRCGNCHVQPSGAFLKAHFETECHCERARKEVLKGHRCGNCHVPALALSLSSSS